MTGSWEPVNNLESVKTRGQLDHLTPLAEMLKDNRNEGEYYNAYDGLIMTRASKRKSKKLFQRVVHQKLISVKDWLPPVDIRAYDQRSGDRWCLEQWFFTIHAAIKCGVLDKASGVFVILGSLECSVHLWSANPGSPMNREPMLFTPEELPDILNHRKGQA